MKRTTVTCTDTDGSVGADILSRSDRTLKVALDGTSLTLVLKKRDPSHRYYVGSRNGLEFTSTGEEIGYRRGEDV